MSQDADVTTFMEMIHDAALNSGFLVGESDICLSPEQLMGLKVGNNFDLTDMLEDFAFNVIEGAMNLKNLMEIEGTKQ